MAIEHMVMVFEAEGLSSSEKCLLLAYANFTDAQGYCWPGIDRLRLMTGMSKSTVIRTRQSLEDKKLLRHQRRTSKGGRSDTNLYRINLSKLASLRAKNRKFDDDVLSLEFEDDEPPVAIVKTTPDQPMCQNDTLPETGADLPMCQSDTLVGSRLTPSRSQSDTQSLIDPLEDPADRQGEVYPQPDETPACLPGDASGEGAQEHLPIVLGAVRSEAEAVLAGLALPWAVEKSVIRREAAEIEKRLAHWTAAALTRHIEEQVGKAVADYGGPGAVRKPMGVLVDVLRNIPDAPATKRPASAQKNSCSEHPTFGMRADGQCAGCFAAQFDREDAAEDRLVSIRRETPVRASTDRSGRFVAGSR